MTLPGTSAIVDQRVRERLARARRQHRLHSLPATTGRNRRARRRQRRVAAAEPGGAQ